mmetsp:Transcript_4550/g.14614  ORF Transcript_4550/g.14614 Transcript_4550/m.14614 type:complete len:444 (+) Transcript_4550:90-1421(+)
MTHQPTGEAIPARPPRRPHWAVGSGRQMEDDDGVRRQRDLQGTAPHRAPRRPRRQGLLPRELPRGAASLHDTRRVVRQRVDVRLPAARPQRAQAVGDVVPQAPAATVREGKAQHASPGEPGALNAGQPVAQQPRTEVRVGGREGRPPLDPGLGSPSDVREDLPCPAAPGRLCAYVYQPADLRAAAEHPIGAHREGARVQVHLHALLDSRQDKGEGELRVDDAAPHLVQKEAVCEGLRRRRSVVLEEEVADAALGLPLGQVPAEGLSDAPPAELDACVRPSGNDGGVSVLVVLRPHCHEGARPASVVVVRDARDEIPLGPALEGRAEVLHPQLVRSPAAPPHLRQHVAHQRHLHAGPHSAGLTHGRRNALQVLLWVQVPMLVVELVTELDEAWSLAEALQLVVEALQVLLARGGVRADHVEGVRGVVRVRECSSALEGAQPCLQ